MKKIYTLSLMAVLLGLIFTGIKSYTVESSTGNDQKIRKTDDPIQAQDARRARETFAPAKKMLLAADVPFDPEIMLSPNWKQEIAPYTYRMREMRDTLRTSSKISGVKMADTLILPEKVELTGDLILIANTIVYEGTQTVIKGFGKKVFVYPIYEAFHLPGTFEESMARQGVTSELLPGVDQRVAKKFEFPEKAVNSVLTISVNGRGYDDWLEDQKKLKDFGRSPSVEPANVDCPAQTPFCNGEEGGMGVPGTDGYPSGNVPANPRNGVDGVCGIRNISSGLPGLTGDSGDTGPNNATIGGLGNTGGTGGTIVYNITAPFNSVYVFEAKGGKGGMGGTGGRGAPGDNAQDGGNGGDGADCSCQLGGAGSGAPAGDGGRGGKGAQGARGGKAGRGGNGGIISVTFPNQFPEPPPIVARYGGGDSGTPGEGGRGGYAGVSGNGGRGGRALGNFNCPDQSGRSYPDGVQPPSLGPGEQGPEGESNSSGDSGNYFPNRLQGGGCNPYNNPGGCSPILLDINNDGYRLTDYYNGVPFDLSVQGYPSQTAWTAAGSDDAFLVLDRNGNGSIDNGLEVFGNFTAQPDTAEPNGFEALAVFDRADQGGNGDNRITAEDKIFKSLQLWQDRNHNGVSEADELRSLPYFSVVALDLEYLRSDFVDEFGNEFRYGAKFWENTQRSGRARWAWDVFFVNPPSEKH